MPELRSSIRIPTPPGREAAVLRIGHQSIHCQLFNESCGGFGLKAPKGSPVFVGMTAVLGAQGGWHRVRVVHVQDDPEAEDMVIGLERRGELPQDWHLREREGVWFPGKRAASTPGWTSWVTGALVVGGMLIALVIWQWDVVFPKPSRPIENATAAVRSASAQAAEAAKRAAAEARSLAFSPAYVAELGALLTPGVDSSLDISGEQRAQIAAIVKSRDEALRKLYGSATASSTQVLQLEVAWKQRAAAEEIWNVLTPEQRQKVAAKHKRSSKAKR